MKKEEKESNKARTFHLRLGSVSLFALHAVAGLGWFRLFGVGLHCKDTARHRMFFSERNGYTKALKIGTWRISFLPFVKLIQNLPHMKNLILFFAILPFMASAQQQKPRTDSLYLIDTIIQPFEFYYYRDHPGVTAPQPITVRIYRDDDDKIQTLIDALKKAGVIVERTEWNYEKGYSEYIINKQ